jgi:hypothetical protein
MSPMAISVVVFVCAFGSAIVGFVLGRLLPAHHVSPESKDAVRLGMGIVATTVALVLGLLIASSKSFYDTQNSEVTQLAANLVMLDKVLKHYGPETHELRALVRDAVRKMVDVNADTLKQRFDPKDQDGIYDSIQALTPGNESQKRLQSEALNLTMQLGQIRWLMYEQESVPIPKPLISIVIFWLSALFLSFGIFARPNFTVVASLLVASLALAGAIFLIAEMYAPYGGLIQFSDAPLRVALTELSK